MAKHFRGQFGRDPVGEHVGCACVLLDPVAESRLQLPAEAEVGKGVFRGGRTPHLVGARHREARVLQRSAADGYAFHAGTAGVARFRHAVHQDRDNGPLGPARHVEHRPGRAFFLADLFLKEHQSLDECLGAGRAAGNVEVHRNDLVHPLHHAVDIVHAAGVGAAPHGNDPARLGHLFVESKENRGYLLENGAGHDHQVRFPGGAAQHLGAETGNVVLEVNEVIISTKQQEVPKNNGQREFARPQLIRSSRRERSIFCGISFSVIICL